MCHLSKAEDIMTRKAPPEIEFRWTNGSFKVVGEFALVLVAIVGIAYLVMAHWEKIVG
jgi:hypothetical protein